MYLCGAALLCAQSGGGSSSSPASPSSTSSSSSSSKGETGQGTYVRRLSLGATLSVVGLTPLNGSTSSPVTTTSGTTSVSTSASTTPVSSRTGYGLTGQVAITDHFAVSVGAYLRRIGFNLTTTVITDTTTFVNGNSTTNTAATSTESSARTRVLDIPLLVRYYMKGRHTPGARWFAEGGGALREAIRTSSSLSATDASGNITCCTTGVIQPTHRSSRGFVGGAGAQFIDPFGIRVVPEVRYTRWVTGTFENPTTQTQRNEVEAALTLSF